jgi:polyketide synthase PksL
VVLSARDGERLRISAERLRDFLRRRHADGRAPELADLAFTLQNGREAMESRLGFVAEDTGGVLDVLDRFLKGEEPGGRNDGSGRHTGMGWHTGTLRRSRGAGVRRDRAQDPRVTRALREGRLDEATALWCEGALVDWQSLHPAGERRTVRLPAYPFARRRYWVPVEDPGDAGANGAGPSVPASDTAAYGSRHRASGPEVAAADGQFAADASESGPPPAVFDAAAFDAGAYAAVLDAVLDGSADPDELGRV